MVNVHDKRYEDSGPTKPNPILNVDRAAVIVSNIASDDEPTTHPMGGSNVRPVLYQDSAANGPAATVGRFERWANKLEKEGGVGRFIAMQVRRILEGEEP